MMARVLPLVPFILSFLLLLKICQSQPNVTSVDGIWSPPPGEISNQNHETLGSLSLRFYGHENLWELLAGANSLNFHPAKNLTKETPVTVPVRVPSATRCPYYMNSSCLQIIHYIQDQNNKWKDNETISEILKTKLELDDETPFSWGTTINDEDFKEVSRLLSSEEEGQEHSRRSLQLLIPIQILLIGWDIFTLVKENIALTPSASGDIFSTCMINIINQTPNTLTNFYFLSPTIGLQSTYSYWLPRLVESGKTGQIVSYGVPEELSIGTFKFSLDGNPESTFTLSLHSAARWYNVNDYSAPYVTSYNHGLKMISGVPIKYPWFDYMGANRTTPQGWNISALDAQYSIKAFVGGTDRNLVATIILYEDWGEGGYDPRDVQSQPGFYRILNNQKDFKLITSTNYSSPLNPHYQVYQHSTGTDWKLNQEWRIEMKQLEDTEAYFILNQNSGLLLAATGTNRLALQRYDPAATDDNLRAQLWLLKKTADQRFIIKNLHFKTFLSSEGKTKDQDFWTLKESLDTINPSNNKFFLELLRIDIAPPTQFIQENFYYLLSPELILDMKITALKDSDSLQILYPNANDGTQEYWLIKEVTVPLVDIKGYLIMNHQLNVVLTVTNDMKVVAKPLSRHTNFLDTMSQLWNITWGLSPFTKTRYTISTLRNASLYLSLDGTTPGSQLILTDNPNPLGFIFTNTNIKGYTPFKSSTWYHLTSFGSKELYLPTPDTLDKADGDSSILGKSLNGQGRQKWQINAADWGVPNPDPDAYNLLSSYTPFINQQYYLTNLNLNGFPRLTYGHAGMKNRRSWRVEPDPDYYNLTYQIRMYNLTTTYLTAPILKTENAIFTLEEKQTNPALARYLDQRFRIIAADQVFPSPSTSPPTKKTVYDNYNYTISPEISPNLKVTAKNNTPVVFELTSDAVSVNQYWLIKKVTSPQIGFVIINQGFKLSITLRNDLTLNYMTQMGATESEALSQIWDIQSLDENVYTIRNLKNPDFYLSLNGTTLIPSKVPFPFIFSYELIPEFYYEIANGQFSDYLVDSRDQNMRQYLRTGINYQDFLLRKVSPTPSNPSEKEAYIIIDRVWGLALTAEKEDQDSISLKSVINKNNATTNSQHWSLERIFKPSGETFAIKSVRFNTSTVLTYAGSVNDKLWTLKKNFAGGDEGRVYFLRGRSFGDFHNRVLKIRRYENPKRVLQISGTTPYENDNTAGRLTQEVTCSKDVSGGVEAYSLIERSTQKALGTNIYSSVIAQSSVTITDDFLWIIEPVPNYYGLVWRFKNKGKNRYLYSPTNQINTQPYDLKLDTDEQYTLFTFEIW